MDSSHRANRSSIAKNMLRNYFFRGTHSRMTKPTLSEFTELAGVSVGYACDMLKGNRPMPRPLAIHVFKRTGWQHDSIAELTDAQIEVLAAVDQWTPPKERAAA